MNIQPKILLVIHFFMASVILGIAFLLLFTDVFSQPGQGLLIENPNRTILVVIFMFYAFYRFIRGWQLFKRHNREIQRKKWQKI